MEINALRQTPDGSLIDLQVGNLRITTPEPITDAAAREYARLIRDSFGVEIDGVVWWT